jgi:hypothetical protein
MTENKALKNESLGVVIGMSPDDAIDLLADVACPYLTQKELAGIRGLSEEAVAGLRRFANVVDGLGGLISSDNAEGRGGIAAGDFLDGDSLSELLFALASFARMTTGLLNAAERADEFERYPKLRSARTLGGEGDDIIGERREH